MPNVVQVLREEIQRLSRKEVKRYASVLKKASAQHRRTLAAIKRELAALQRRFSTLERTAAKGPASEPSPADSTEGVRFSAKSTRAQRRRAGLSAGDYGKLIGVTAQAVYNWERGVSRPRAAQLAALVALRGLGKREATARLTQVLEAAKAKKQAARPRGAAKKKA